MDPVLLIGRYPFSHWALGTRPGGIESYRLLPQLGVLPCDRGDIGGSPWLLRFVTVLIRFADLMTKVNWVWVAHVPLKRLGDVFLCLKNLAFCVGRVSTVKEVDRRRRHNFLHLSSEKHAYDTDQL